MEKPKGLGPNQIAWLKKNVAGFKDASEAVCKARKQSETELERLANAGGKWEEKS